MVKYEQSENGYFYKIANNKSIRISKEEFIKKTKVKGGATSASAAGGGGGVVAAGGKSNHYIKYNNEIEEEIKAVCNKFKILEFGEAKNLKNNHSSSSQRHLIYNLITNINNYIQIYIAINDNKYSLIKVDINNNVKLYDDINGEKAFSININEFTLNLADFIFGIIAPELVYKYGVYQHPEYNNNEGQNSPHRQASNRSNSENNENNGNNGNY